LARCDCPVVSHSILPVRVADRVYPS
jgi:hypothetical protein